MKVPKRTFTGESTENFINAVFAIVTIGILLSVFLTDEHDVYGYYQNLLIASFSAAITIIHICREIRDNKTIGLSPPRHISIAYALCKAFMLFNCAVPICFYASLNKISFLLEHMLSNKYWGICLITFIPICYVIIYGYIYPIITDIPYESSIRMEERPEQNEVSL